MFKKIKTECDVLFTYNEICNIYYLAKSTIPLQGAWAEVGVYQGGSAKLLSTLGNKLYAYDTFEGLPEVGKNDPKFKTGEYAASFEKVKSYLDGVTVVKGLFPQSAIEDSYSFVHLDVDTYQSTLESLKYFYPRMVKGGIILTHDYWTGSGAKLAFDEFFNNKVIPIDVTQAFIVN